MTHSYLFWIASGFVTGFAVEFVAAYVYRPVSMIISSLGK